MYFLTNTYPLSGNSPIDLYLYFVLVFSASIMLDVLEKYHDKDQYDPDIPDSVFRDNIEQFFDDVKYDSGYLYHLYETDILLNPNDIHTYNRLKDYAKESMRNIYERGEEVDLMSDIVTIRFLIKEKKKRYC